MNENRTTPRITVSLAGAAVFATLAGLLTLMNAEIPFPLIPYLQIDFAEIPIIMAFFLFGPISALVAAIIQWLFLNVRGVFVPLGPALKFVAVTSTLMGFWLGNQIYRSLKGDRVYPTLALSTMLGGGILFRVAAMTATNYLVLVYVAPFFFGAAKSALENSTGWHFTSDTMVLTYTLIFTALYNLVNLLVAAVPAGLIVSPISNSFKHITSIDAWLTRNLRS